MRTDQIVIIYFTERINMFRGQATDILPIPHQVEVGKKCLLLRSKDSYSHYLPVPTHSRGNLTCCMGRMFVAWPLAKKKALQSGL